MAGDNRLVTEKFMADNFSYYFSLGPPYVPGDNNTISMSCDQIKNRYAVQILGVTSTGNRCPSQNQIFQPINLTINRLVIVGSSETTASISGTIPPINGFVTGDPSVIEYGFVWSTSGTPTINDSKIVAQQTNVINRTVYFSATLTGLTEGTVYYARAYAINNTGVSYGSYYQGTTLITAGTVFVPNNYYVGRMDQGGVIADVYYNTGTYETWNVPFGLIVHPADIGSAPWGCGGYNNAEYSNYGSGPYNTHQIDIQCADSSAAAKICAALNTNGYTDWFLPSEGELDTLITNTQSYVYWDLSALYWSSTETRNDAFKYDNAIAWSNFGGMDEHYKGNSFRVMPCRNLLGFSQGYPYLE